jgi:hypothetical protein
MHRAPNKTKFGSNFVDWRYIKGRERKRGHIAMMLRKIF